MNCPNCNSTDIRIMTNMVVAMPVDMYYKVTKAKMRRKEFQVWGVSWDTASFVCANCGYTLFQRKEGE